MKTKTTFRFKELSVEKFLTGKPPHMRTSRAIAEYFGVNQSTARYWLEKWAKQGQLIRKDLGRGWFHRYSYEPNKEWRKYVE